MYKAAQRSYWTVEDIDFSGDLVDWMSALGPDERNMLSVVLACFAASDGIFGDNLVQQFSDEVRAPEARCFYGFQIMMCVSSVLFTLLFVDSPAGRMSTRKHTLDLSESSSWTATSLTDCSEPWTLSLW